MSGSLSLEGAMEQTTGTIPGAPKTIATASFEDLLELQAYVSATLLVNSVHDVCLQCSMSKIILTCFSLAFCNTFCLSM